MIGNYTVLSNTIKLSIKALDSDNGFVIASTSKDLPLDGDAGAILGIDISSDSPDNNNGTNRGFNNTSLSSNEFYNNPETVNKFCEQKNTGNYCFKNGTNKKLKVFIGNKEVRNVTLDNSSKNITLAPGQTQCLYDLDTKGWKYQIREATEVITRMVSEAEAASNKNAEYQFEPLEGEILVEKCKSKTFVIK